MSLQNLFNQVVGSISPQNNDDQPSGQSQASSNQGGSMEAIKSSLPGGLAGGLAAGGVMALLMGNKSARKMAGKAVKYGGTAILGGVAYKAYQNWQGNKSPAQAQPLHENEIQQSKQAISDNTDSSLPDLNMTLIKSMIAAAKSDGNIDATEQKAIFDTVDKMQLDNNQKAMVFDCLQNDISVEELASSVTSTEHKAEVYLASFLAIDPDHPAEQAYLAELATALDIPVGFAEHLQQQAKMGVN